VAWEIYPEDQFRQKLAVEMVSGSGSVDGFMSLTSWDGLRFLKAGWYEPIQEYPLEPRPDEPPVRLRRLLPEHPSDRDRERPADRGAALSGSAAAPTTGRTSSQAKNVAVPQTMEEWEDAARN